MQRPLFQLDPRLQLCANFVRTGAKLADVGTDHGYLPVWMEKKGLISSAVAVDIHPGPLSKAQENVARYHAECVTTRLSDGLAKVLPDEAQDIVIAGMGGELIAHILSEAPWVREGDRHLILQPMTSAEDLREYLRQQGFTILQEEAVASRDHVYTVMLAVYCPQQVSDNPLYPYVGALLPNTPAAKQYLQKKVDSLRRKGTGLLQKNPEEAQNFLQIANQLEAFIEREDTV